MNLIKAIIGLVLVVCLIFALRTGEKKSVNQKEKQNGEKQNKETLKVYCAVGIKIPFEKTVEEFEKLYSVDISSEFKGSGHLMGSVKLNPIGDLFIAADSSYTTSLKKDGLIKETLPLAEMHPVIIVQKGNPKNIKSLADFKREDIKIILANPESASIGNVTKKILEAKGDWEAVSANATKNGVFKPTVTEIANDIKMKVMDAAIIWDAIAKQKNYISDFDIIEVDELKTNKETVTVGILTASKNPSLALKFARFLHAKDKGQKHFEAESFTAIQNADTWEDHPTITLYSGGVNRRAIEKTILEFQEREGVTINTSYNGCGILVGQMKAGGKPDAYFACDTSFMTQVNSRFDKPEVLSQTNIVLVVKKGNPLNIKNLEDLAKPGIRLGVGHPEQAALGTLTKKLLDASGLYEKIKPNISVESPSADMIIAQFKTGSLDACLVYTVNVSYMKDEVELIELKDEKSKATQPFGIANYTNNHYLLERFLEAIKNNHNRFTEAGFNYLGSKNSNEPVGLK